MIFSLLITLWIDAENNVSMKHKNRLFLFLFLTSGYFSLLRSLFSSRPFHNYPIDWKIGGVRFVLQREFA